MTDGTGDQIEETGAVAKGDNFARDVGAAVRDRRQELGMASKELAARLGVSASFITQLEQGQSSISLPRLYRLAELLRTTPNGLLPVSSTSILGDPGWNRS